MARWVTFHNPVKFADKLVTGLCVEGDTGEAVVRRIYGSEVADVKSLPYPADPRLRTGEDECPSFCLKPADCVSRGSCPRAYACSE